MQHPGWVALLEIAKAQVHNRRVNHMRAPLKEGVSLAHQQWELGEASGMELLMTLPMTLIEAGTSIVKEHTQTEEANNVQKK